MKKNKNKKDGATSCSGGAMPQNDETGVSPRKSAVKIMDEKEHILEKSKGDEYEYDYEGDMAMSQLKSIMTNAKCIHDMLKPNTNLPEWVQSKITLAKDYIETACDYLETQMNEEAIFEAGGKSVNAREYAEKGFIHPEHARILNSGQQYQDWYGSPYKEEDGTVDKTAKHHVAIRMIGGHSFKLTHADGPNMGKSWILRIGHPKLEEETIQEGRSLTFQQRLARARQMKRIEPKVYRGQLRYQERVPSQSRLEKRAERMARNIIKQKISHTPYDQMSIPEKIMIDKILERKQKAIKRLAQRLLPKVRQISIERISGPSTQPKMPIQRLVMGEETIPYLSALKYLSESVETIYALAAGEETKAVIALKEKAEKAGVSFEEIVEVYSEAVQKYTPRKISSEQYAFNAVNSFVSNKLNEDFRKMSVNQMFSDAFVTESLIDRLNAKRKIEDAKAARFAKPPKEGEEGALDKALRQISELPSGAQSVKRRSEAGGYDVPPRTNRNR